MYNNLIISTIIIPFVGYQHEFIAFFLGKFNVTSYKINGDTSRICICCFIIKASLKFINVYENGKKIVLVHYCANFK